MALRSQAPRVDARDRRLGAGIYVPRACPLRDGASPRQRTVEVGAPPEITEVDVQKARGQLLHELDELRKAIVAAGGDLAELEAARHPTEQILTDALHHLSETERDHAALTPEHLETMHEAEDFIHTGNTPVSTSSSNASSLIGEILHDANASAPGEAATGTNTPTGTATGTSA